MEAEHTSSTPGPRLTVREVQCRTVLNKGGIGDYSMNCYTGCSHACVYCYARFMQRFHPHPEPWGGFVDVKVNAVEVLQRQLRRMSPGAVFVSSACDAWQPMERERRLTRACVELLLEHGFRVNALTKSALVLRDLDVFAGANARIGVTVTCLDESLRKSESRRFARKPLTTSLPLSNSATSRGRSSGSSCRSLSMKTKARPRAWVRPAVMAAVWPALRNRSITVATWGSRRWMARSFSQVASVLPSFTITIS